MERVKSIMFVFMRRTQRKSYDIRESAQRLTENFSEAQTHDPVGSIFCLFLSCSFSQEVLCCCVAQAEAALGNMATMH